MNLDPRFFLSNEVHLRIVKLPDGTEQEMNFRELSRAEVRTLADKELNGSDIADRMLQVCLCDEGGQPLLSLEQVLTLRPTYFNAISEHVAKVNGIGEEREQAKA